MSTPTRCNNGRGVWASSGRRNRRRSQGGFTLVELLVVVAILALLVSILLPSLNKAKAAARAVVCMTRLKGIMLATFIYTQEYNGWVHAAYGTAEADGGDGLAWFWVMEDEELLPGVESDISYCPSTNVVPRTVPSWYGYGMRAQWGDGKYGTGYYNLSSTFVQWRSGDIETIGTFDYAPAEFVLYMDSISTRFYAGQPEVAWQTYIVLAVADPTRRYCVHQQRHNDRANCAFGDGHVEALGRKRLEDGGFPDEAIWPLGP